MRKKVKNFKNYLYLFHSLYSTFKSYTKNAFDNYDIILANGSHQVKEIRKNEKLFNLKKVIFNIGYPYLENLKERYILRIKMIQFCLHPHGLITKMIY